MGDTNVHSKFFTDVVIIGITYLLVGLFNFLLFPLITKTLGVDHYAIWVQISLLVGLLTPLALLGLTQSMIRFLAAETDADKIREGFYSIVLFVALIGLGISVVVIVCSDFLAGIIFHDAGYSTFIKVGSALIVFNALAAVPVYFLRVVRKIITFSVFTILLNGLQFSLVFVLISLGFGVMGVIFGSLLASGVVFIISISLIISQIGFAFPSFSNIHLFLKYGLPLTPNPIIDWIRSSSDRYFIGFFLGVSAVGIYSASNGIGTLLVTLVTPLQLILFPSLSKLFDENNMNKVREQLTFSVKYFLIIAIPAAFGVSILSVQLITLLTTTEFLSGAFLIPFFAFGSVFFGVYQITINTLQLVKKTHISFYIYLVTSILSIALNLSLIPVFSILGAALASLITLIFLAFITTAVSLRYIQFAIDYVSIIKIIFSSLIISAVVLFLNPISLIMILVSILFGFLIYCVMIILLKVITSSELQFFRGIVSSYCKFL